jgi:mRNA interferase HicA
MLSGENRRGHCPVGTFRIDSISNIAYTGEVKSSEFRRWLAAQGATFSPGKGSHLRVELNGKISYLPMHHKDLKKGTLEDIKKQLGLQ